MIYIYTADITAEEPPLEPHKATLTGVMVEVDILPMIATKPTKEERMLACSCITFMRQRGHKFPVIPDPSYLEPNSMPVIGGLVLFKFGDYAHIGEILDMRNGGMFIHHRYLSGDDCITTTGFVAWESIRGVYKE